MRRFGSSVSLVVVLAGAAASSAPADTLTAAADAQTSSAQPALRFGPLPAMAVREGAKGALVSYARFDVSSLAEGPAVQSAVLRLWVRTVAAPGTIEVLPVLGPWQESAISGGSAPELGAPVAVFSVEERHAARFVDVDITGLVRDWATGALENHGLALRGDGAGAVNVTFHTREGFLTTHIPALEVVRAGGAGSDADAPRAPEGGLAPNRIPAGAVMFFDLTACPQGWTALAEARGRAIVGLNPGGTLRGTVGTPLTDQGLRLISGVPSHGHTTLVTAESAHTHTVNLSADGAHTHTVSIPDHAAVTFTSALGGGHNHTGTTTMSGNHQHTFGLNSGSISGSFNDAFPGDLGGAISGTGETNLAGQHDHLFLTDPAPSHMHSITVPLHSHTGTTVSAASTHSHAAVVGGGSSHTHSVTVNPTGSPTVDVTLPYIQLLACRKD